MDMNGIGPRREAAPDDRLLDEVRQLWVEADPVPPALPDRIRFAVRLATLESELTSMPAQLEVAGIRGDETTRVITFERNGLTILVNVTGGETGTLRVDGWLAPPACHEVELLTTAGVLTARCDCDGRFAIEQVQPGMARLAVRPAGGSQRVTTPVIEL
jgi:hypothetical protein